MRTQGSPNRKKAFFFAIVAVLFWSTAPTAFKIALNHQTTVQLLCGASLVSFAVLALVSIITKGPGAFAKLGPRDFSYSLLLGLLNPLAYYLILFKAYSLLPAQVAQPLNMIWPILLVLLSIPLLKQRIGWMSIGAMFISFCGVILISWQGGNGLTNSGNLLGVFLALSTAFIWAFYWIFNARDRTDPVLRLSLNFFFASLFLLVVGLGQPAIFPRGVEAWTSAAYVGIFEMGITFVLWLLAMQTAPSTDHISHLVYLAPFLNLLIVNLLLDEIIMRSTVFGILLIISGILILQITQIRAGGSR